MPRHVCEWKLKLKRRTLCQREAASTRATIVGIPAKMRPTDTRWWRHWREVEGVTVLHVDCTHDANREAHAFDLLDEREKKRWASFLLKDAQRQFALCRAALRIVLSERLGCSNGQLSFGYFEHGKPFARVNGRQASVGFNVSHSGRHGLIGLTDHDRLGVDVEERVLRSDLDEIGASVYGATERRCLANTRGRGKVHLFFRLWSMKEALIKALGCGFSLNPSRFEVPGPVLHGGRADVFRFPHAPSDAWRLLDLGEPRFAAAIAYRLPASRLSGQTSASAALPAPGTRRSAHDSGREPPTERSDRPPE